MAVLAREGFVLREALALDLTAHTFHVEVVATFYRVGGSDVQGTPASGLGAAMRAER